MARTRSTIPPLTPYYHQSASAAAGTQPAKNKAAAENATDDDVESPVYLFVSNEPGMAPRSLSWKLAWSVGPAEWDIGARNRHAWKQIRLELVTTPATDDDGGSEEGEASSAKEGSTDERSDRDREQPRAGRRGGGGGRSSRDGAGARRVRFETRYAYTGPVVRAPGPEVLSTPRFQLAMMSLAERDRIDELARAVEVPAAPPSVDWNCQDWTQDLLKAMVDAEILPLEMCNSAISWGLGDIGYV